MQVEWSPSPPALRGEAGSRVPAEEPGTRDMDWRRGPRLEAVWTPCLSGRGGVFGVCGAGPGVGKGGEAAGLRAAASF